MIQGASGSFAVLDCTVAAGYVLHVGEGGVPLQVGEKITVDVDYKRRGKIVPNHTFTHVLNFALKKILGDHVAQKVQACTLSPLVLMFILIFSFISYYSMHSSYDFVVYSSFA